MTNRRWYSDQPESIVSHWHRALPDMVRGVDLDMVGHCRYCYRRLYVIEATRGDPDHPPTKSWTMAREIADALSCLAAFLIVYDPDPFTVNCSCVDAYNPSCGHGIASASVQQWRGGALLPPEILSGPALSERFALLHERHEQNDHRITPRPRPRYVEPRQLGLL